MKIRSFFLLLPVLLLTGCGQIHAVAQGASFTATSAATPTPPGTLTPTLSLTPVPTGIEPSEEWALWSRSPHAGIPEAAQNPESQCSACHETGKGVEADGLAACAACHSEVEDARKNATQTDPVHSTMTCIQCHEPHSTTASCSNGSCHAGVRPENIVVLATPPGGHPHLSTGFCPSANCHPQATQAALTNHNIHGYRHATVACTACHDASGGPAAPSAKGEWVTLRTVGVIGTPQAVPYMSHAIQASTDCTRCHFEGNTWGLPPVTGDEFGR